MEIMPVDHHHECFTGRDIILVKFILHIELERRDRIEIIRLKISTVKQLLAASLYFNGWLFLRRH